MIGTFLWLMAAGIGLTQAVSDPRQVTLAWLRLGGLISISLMALAAAITILTGNGLTTAVWAGLAAAGLLAVGQLMATQLGRHGAQRLLAALAFVVTVASLVICLSPPRFPGLAGSSVPLGSSIGVSDLDALLATNGPVDPAIAAMLPPAAGLLGGFLMTMLLGHAYLTAGGAMTQRPFERLVIVLAGLLLLRTAVSLVFGLAPWWGSETGPGMERMWIVVMLTARYAVGLVTPAVFVYMTYDCVRRRANQSATGILYVAGVLVIVGEGIGLALLWTTGLAF